VPVLIYSPGVTVIIDSSREGPIDVTDDIAQGSVTLRENAVSNANLSLLNTNGKYDRVFAPNDRIHIEMKRIGPFLPVFSGYLDQTPYFTVYPRSVQLLASCTLKRLRYTVWDAGAAASVNLLGKAMRDDPNGADGGIKQIIMTLMTDVVGWKREAIHIADLPPKWVQKVSDLHHDIVGQLNSTTLKPDQGGAGAGGSGSGAATTGAGGPVGINAYMHATRMVESGNNYTEGNGGAYQILPSNWPKWKAEAGVQDPSPTAELASSQVQDQVARSKMTAYYQAVGNWKIVAQMWNGGHPGAKTTWTSDVHGVKVPYEDAVLSWMPQFAGEDANPQAPPPAPAPGTPGGPAGPPAPLKPPQPGDKSNTAFVQLCLQQKGDAYIFGAAPQPTDPDPKSFDCSALVQWACARLGVSMPRVSDAQARACSPISVDQAFHTAGALLFRDPGTLSAGDSGHVAISLGDGANTIEARGSQYGVNTFPVAGRQWSRAGLIIGLQYSGGPVAGGPGAMGANNSLIQTTSWRQPAPNQQSVLLHGYRVLLNDDPIITTLQTLLQASMRSYMSGPNGDFIAWFPDYFGIYGMAAKMLIEDIELAGDGFSIAWNDQSLITHQFTAGAAPGTSQYLTGGEEAYIMLREYQTEGVVTVDFPDILAFILNARKDDPDAADWLNPEKILQRFGARVNFSPMQYINQGVAEFWCALYLFQQAWASQFMTQVDLTFMPELYPGMLLKLQSFAVQAYVRSVTHSFDFQGGGFTTTAEIMAPSTTDDGGGLYGMVKGVA
jgi:cell wall-associated NlpC family hydrolase